MNNNIRLYKFATFFLLFIGVFILPHFVFASDIRIYPSVSSSGYVSMSGSDCLSSTIGYITTYKGNYSDTSNVVTVNNNTGLACSHIFNGTYTIEGGFVNENGSTPDGFNYWVSFTCGLNLCYFTASKNSGVWSTELPPYTYRTNFFELSPVAGSVVSTTTTIGFKLWLHPDDWNDVSDYYVDVYAVNQQNQAMSGSVIEALPALSPIAHFDLEAGFGNYSLSTSTIFSFSGRNDLYFKLKKFVTSSNWLLGVMGLGSTIELTSSSTYVIVGQNNGYDNLISTTTNSMFDVLSMGTTSIALTDCGAISWAFNPSKCIISLIMPNSFALSKLVTQLQSGILRSFPLGYVSDVVNILNSSSTSVIPSLNVTIPNDGRLGGGSSINLSLSAMTWLWSATSTHTTGTLANKTFYEIISPYWAYLVYILLGFYLISRILGSHLIPTPFEDWQLRNKGMDISTRKGFADANFKTRPRNSGVTSYGKMMIKRGREIDNH